MRIEEISDLMKALKLGTRAGKNRFYLSKSYSVTILGVYRPPTDTKYGVEQND
jgi:hypothetical protein